MENEKKMWKASIEMEDGMREMEGRGVLAFAVDNNEDGVNITSMISGEFSVHFVAAIIDAMERNFDELYQRAILLRGVDAIKDFMLKYGERGE